MKSDCTWRFKPQYFTSMWHFYQAVTARPFPTPRPMRVWSDGVQALHVIFFPFKALFGNSRSGLVVKDCSSTFLSFPFYSLQRKHSNTRKAKAAFYVWISKRLIFIGLSEFQVSSSGRMLFFIGCLFDDLLAMVNALEK